MPLHPEMVMSDPHPGGRSGNSPTFQRWVGRVRDAQVPKGRPNSFAASAVPSGLIQPRVQVPNVETLGYYHLSLRDKRKASPIRPSDFGLLSDFGFRISDFAPSLQLLFS